MQLSRENSTVTGLEEILLKARFNSCFREYFTKFFKGHHLLMIGYFPLASVKDLFALTILTGPILYFFHFFI